MRLSTAFGMQNQQDDLLHSILSRANALIGLAGIFVGVTGRYAVGGPRCPVRSLLPAVG